MRLFTVLSRLLDYPTDELIAHLPEIRSLVEQDGEVAADERQAVLDLVNWMEGQDLLALQSVYVDTFDHTPEHSLHLTHHSLGDSRDRGPALVELGEHYKSHGFEADGELPDYLPLILEYVAMLDDLQARFFLGEAAGVLEALAANLDKARSPYAGLVRIIERRGRLARNAA